MSINKMKKLLAFAILAAFVAAGCGSGDAGTVDSKPGANAPKGANAKTGKGGAMENDNGLFK